MARTVSSMPLFLISLKAGGRGLNLTSADTVIHYDPWWNPAVENQASDRAHRIGQTKSVFVYKMIAVDTVEERILELQQRKAELASIAFQEGGGLAFNAEDIDYLFGGERSAELYLVFADRDYAGPGARRLAEVIRTEVGEQCKAHAHL